MEYQVIISDFWLLAQHCLALPSAIVTFFSHTHTHTRPGPPGRRREHRPQSLELISLCAVKVKLFNHNKDGRCCLQATTPQFKSLFHPCLFYLFSPLNMLWEPYFVSSMDVGGVYSNYTHVPLYYYDNFWFCFGNYAGNDVVYFCTFSYPISPTFLGYII